MTDAVTLTFQGTTPSISRKFEEIRAFDFEGKKLSINGLIVALNGKGG